MNHPNEPNICTGEGNGTLRFSNFQHGSPLAEFDYWDVQMCDPCRNATIKEKT